MPAFNHVIPGHASGQTASSPVCRLEKQRVSQLLFQQCSANGASRPALSHPWGPSNPTWQRLRLSSSRIQRTGSGGRLPPLASAPDSAPLSDDSGWDRPAHEKEAELLFRSAQREGQQEIGAEYGEVSRRRGTRPPGWLMSGVLRTVQISCHHTNQSIYVINQCKACNHPSPKSEATLYSDTRN